MNEYNQPRRGPGRPRNPDTPRDFELEILKHPGTLEEVAKIVGCSVAAVWRTRDRFPRLVKKARRTTAPNSKFALNLVRAKLAKLK